MVNGADKEIETVFIAEFFDEVNGGGANVVGFEGEEEGGGGRVEVRVSGVGSDEGGGGGVVGFEGAE